MYRVEDNDGNVSDLDRIRLCHWKKHVFYYAHVSDGKKHDCFAMQHIYTAEIEWLEGYMNDEFADEIPERNVTHLHIHSDNAGQHFKSYGAFE